MPESTSAAAEPQPFHIVLVGDPQDERIAAVMNAVEHGLSDGCSNGCPVTYRVSRVGPDGMSWPGLAGSADVVIAIGSRAGEVVAQNAIEVRTLYAFLPQVAWQELQACCLVPDKPYSALIIDQPLQRQFDLVQLVAPDAKRIGVLLGSVSADRRDELINAARAKGYELIVADVGTGNEIGPSLRRLVQDADVLLALPDPAVYNRNTAYSILLTTYGARIPVVGFSRAMVKAGAAAAVFATPEDVGLEIAQLLQAYWHDGRMPPPGFGTSYSVSVNRDVTRSLRLPDFTEDELLQRMESLAP